MALIACQNKPHTILPVDSV